jgi:hypothetical protein
VRALAPLFAVALAGCGWTRYYTYDVEGAHAGVVVADVKQARVEIAPLARGRTGYTTIDVFVHVEPAETVSDLAAALAGRTDAGAWIEVGLNSRAEGARILDDLVAEEDLRALGMLDSLKRGLRDGTGRFVHLHYTSSERDPPLPGGLRDVVLRISFELGPHAGRAEREVRLKRVSRHYFWLFRDEGPG